MALTQFKDTPFGKAVRTAQQAFVVIGPVFLGIMTLPEVQHFLAEYWPWILPALIPIIAIVTYLHNRYGK